MTRSLPASGLLRAAFLLLVVAIAGCSDTPTSPLTQPPPASVPVGKLGVFASLSDGTTTLVIQVSGPNIVKADGVTPDTLAFNIPLVNNVATGSVTIPAGSSRVIVARAFNGLVETHRGQTTADIVAGNNPTVNITMVPLAGSTPVQVSIGTTLVIVRPSVATLNVGDTLRLSAEVRNQDGNIVPGAVARWATLNPNRATIDTLGLVTVRDTGDVQIVATYGTVGGSMKVTGRTASSAAPYHLTWNGSVSRNWNDVNNWTPHGIGSARVPTASDSVDIPAAPSNQPQIQVCSDQNVQHLMVATGASLNSTCGYSLNVYGSAISRGTTNAQLLLRPGARIGGVFRRLYVFGDSVRMIDSVRVTDYLEVNQTGSQLRLNGKRLVAQGSVYLYDGTIKMAAGDTAVFNSDVYWNGAAQDDLLSGGTVYFRGTSFYGYRYNASGTNRLVVDRAGGGPQYIYGFDYVNSPGRNGLQKLEIKGSDDVRICSHITIADSVIVASTGSPIVVTSAGCSSYQVRAYGPISTTTNTTVSNYLWEIRHASGTSGVNGVWNPSYSDFDVTNAIVKPGLSYQHIRFFAPNQFTGTTTATGYLWIDGATVIVNINGQQVTADRLDVRNNALLQMQNANDRLTINGNAEFQAGNSDAQMPLLSAGVLSVGSRFYGNGFSATGTHKVILTGTVSGERYIHGLRYDSRPNQGFQNLEVRAQYGICSEYPRVKGDLTVTATGIIDQSTCGGNGVLRIDGVVTTAAGSSVTPYQVVLNDVSGTANVQGTWSPGYTDFYAAGAFIKPLSTYQNLRVFATTTLQGNTTASGYLWIDGATAKLKLNGFKIGAYRLDVRNNALLEMSDPNDSLGVATVAEFNSNNSDAEMPLLSAGVLSVGSRFNGTGFSASGTHKVILTGTEPSEHYIHGMRYDSRPNQGFQNLEVRAQYGVCSDFHRVKGDLTVTASGILDQTVCGGSGHVRVDNGFTTAPGSTIGLYEMILNNASGTQNVLGAYQPTHTSITNAVAVGNLRGGLNYQNLNLYTSIVLGAPLTVAGDLTINGVGVDLRLNGQKVTVGGRFDLNSNGTITMDNAADSLVLNGNDSYWDGGTSENGRLTAGAVVVNVGYFCASNYYGSGTHKTVFSRTAGSPVRVACVNNADPGPQPFNDVEVKNDGIRLEANMYVNGNMVVRSGSKVDPHCSTGNLWVVGTLTTEAGSMVTNQSGCGGYLAVVLKNQTGTGQVNGSYDPNWTYFQALNAVVKPSLAYRYARFDRSTSLSGRTVFNSSVDVINDNTVLSLNGNTMDVKYGFNLDNTAQVQMTNPLDSLIVGSLDATSDFYWDGGTKPANTLTAGTIVFYGDRFYGPNYAPNQGTHKFVFKSDAAGGPISLEGRPVFAGLELAGLRSVSINDYAAVQDTMRISVPTVLTGQNYIHVASGGALVTVAGSDVTIPNVYLDDASGLRFATGGFHPTGTVYFRAQTGHAQALRVVSNVRYPTVQIEGAYTLPDSVTFNGNFATVQGSLSGIPNLNFNGKRLRVTGNVEMGLATQFVMQNATDSLITDGYYILRNNAAAPNLTNGVLEVRGDYFDDQKDGVVFSTASSAHKLVMNGSGASNQTIYAYHSNGWRNLANVEIRGSRPVVLNYETQIDGTFNMLPSTSVTSNQYIHFGGPLVTAPGSTLQITGTAELSHNTGLSNVAGTYNVPGTTKFLNGGTLKFGSGFTYGSLDLAGSISQSGTPFTIAGNLYVRGGGILSTLAGPSGSIGGLTQVFATGQLIFNAPMTSSNYVEVLGSVTFNDLFTSTSDLYVRNGGTATAPISNSNYVTFPGSIQLNSGGTLDNGSGVSRTGGFRTERSPTERYFENGTRIGPAPVDIP